MTRVIRVLVTRAILVVPQVLGITAVIFFLVRLLPGDPVISRLGGHAPEETIENLRQQLGLDLPLHIQYVNYMEGLLRGDLGDSWRTAQPVLEDLKVRLPATMELIFLGMGIALVAGILIGVISAWRQGGLIDRGTIFYTLIAGALPEFYIGIIMVFLFYVLWSIAPHPAGRLGLAAIPPPQVTGMYLIDSALAGQWDTFRDSAAHLVLPVITLSFWQAGAIMKMTRSTMLQVLDGDFINFARLAGLKPSIIRRYALRNALPPVIGLTITVFAVLLGGIVLIEQVFSWGGLGQYSVEAVTASDYEAITGFLMLAATISLFLFILLDIAHAVIDPRVDL